MLLQGDGTPTDGLDLLIYAVVALFLLSIITEKLVNLIRKYPLQFELITSLASGFLFAISVVSFWRYRNWEFFVLIFLFLWSFLISAAAIGMNLFKHSDPASDWRIYPWVRKIQKLIIRLNNSTHPFRNVSKKVKTNEEDAAKEISALSLLVGFFIAFTFNASIFDVFSREPGDFPKDFEWGDTIFNMLLTKFSFDPHLRFDALRFLGITLTGFFLSFGSKFFHDLLDTLYQAKEAKRKLQNKDTYSQESISSFDTYVNTPTSDIVRKAIAQHSADLKTKYKDLLAVEPGNTVSNKPGIILTFADKIPESYPGSLRIDLGNNAVANVPVEAFVKETAIAQSAFESRLESPDLVTATGAVGAILFSGSGGEMEKYILSCSHVVMAGSSEDQQGKLVAEKNLKVNIKLKNKTKYKADLVYAKLDSSNDTALIRLPDALKSWTNNLPSGKSFREPRSLEQVDLTENVYFYSSLNKKLIKGSIHKLQSEITVSIRYADGVKKEFNKLMVIGDNSSGYWQALSVGGDSGSVLFSSEYEPLAMIIAGGNQFSYAIPIIPILEETNTRILNS